MIIHLFLECSAPGCVHRCESIQYFQAWINASADGACTGGRRGEAAGEGGYPGHV